MEKFVLIDGHSILNRAFYGVPVFTNSEGIYTNAVFGFLNILFKLIDEEQPDYLAVAFDVHQPTFRHEMYKEYKGTRKPMMPELREQVPLIKEVLHTMNITTVELPGYEADDVIGTLSKRGEKDGLDVCVYSGDRDLLQLAAENIMICIPKTKKGQTTVERYKPEDVKDLYKVTPVEFIDVKALMGDSSDNIPGVPGIGEKGATAIISQFGSIENAFQHEEEIANTRNKNALLEHYDMAQMSKTLATINIDSPVTVSPKECVLGDIYTDNALQMLKRLEFKSMLNRFENVSVSNDFEKNFEVIRDYTECNTVFNEASSADNIGLYIYIQDHIKGIAICCGDDYIKYISIEGFITEELVISELRKLIKNGAEITVNNIKSNNSIYNADRNSHIFDVEIAAYLLNPLQNTYDYDDIARNYLGMTVPSYAEIFPKTKKGETPSAEIEENIVKYSCYNALVMYKAREVLEKKLKEQGMLDVYKNI